MPDVELPDLPKLAVAELVQRALELSRECGPELHALVSSQDFSPLEAERARRFYTRVIGLIRGHQGIAGDELVEMVRAEVDALVASESRANGADTLPSIELADRHGLERRAVAPTPVFNGIPVALTEGFVDVEALRPWDANPRLELALMEFKDVRNAHPDNEELTELLQGQLSLPGLKDDPYKLEPLARSIARKGVERPLIVTDDGLVLDGNRRRAASLLTLHGRDATDDERERARWVRVWKLEPGATDDQINAVVVALNFENELKEPWPEFVKARKVVERYDMMRERRGTRLSAKVNTQIKQGVAAHFAIKTNEVTRYIKMVQWADDFQQYHEEEGVHEIANVRYRTDKIFQWFYEIDAGRGNEKLTKILEVDDQLKAIVYDLMFDVLDSGVQVRGLHKVVADPEAVGELNKAHKLAETDSEQALEVVVDAIDTARRRSNKRRRGASAFDEFLRSVVERIGSVAPDEWKRVDEELLRDTLRVCKAAAGSAEGALAANADFSD